MTKKMAAYLDASQDEASGDVLGHGGQDSEGLRWVGTITPLVTAT